MSIKVYKYALSQGRRMDEVEDYTCISMQMPARHVLLDIQMQRGLDGNPTPTIWAEVDTESEVHDFRFWVILTGDELPALPEDHFLVYLRTLQDPATGMVLHIYQQQFKVKA